MCNDIKKLPFEAAMEELEKIVAKLEQGNAPLEEAISLYEKGATLRIHCDSLLEKAKMRIEKISQPLQNNPSGDSQNITLSDFDAGDD